MTKVAVNTATRLKLTKVVYLMCRHRFD